MKLDAVLHIPMSEYCCGLDERHIVYRLRCAKGDMKRSLRTEPTGWTFG